MLWRLRYHWNLITKERPKPIHLDERYREPLVQLLSYMAPQRAEGVEKKRYGTRFDGGYIMLDDFKGITGAFSLGIAYDVKWDLAMASKGLSIWQYDYTVEGPHIQDPKFEFHKVRIGTSKMQGVESKTLSELIATRPGEEMFLKIDIEGSEWEVFAEVEADKLKVFRQIMIEFHDFHKIAETSWTETARTALENLGRNHGVVHVHGNNFGPLVIAGDVRVPSGLEVTYARKDAYHLVPTTETFPGKGDRRNHPYWPDVPLGRFIFEQSPKTRENKSV